MNIRLHRVVGWLLVTVLTPGLANAYELLTENGVCPNGIRWTSDQHISVNISNAGAQALELSVAVSDVATRVSNVGGQWFDYLLPYGVDTSAYQLLVKGSPDGDGINEIGLADLSAFGTNVLGMGPTDVDATNCTINEGDVFLDSRTYTWDFTVPPDGTPDTCTTEDCYFDAQQTRCSDGSKYEGCATGQYIYWGRTAMLHEIGHTLGLGHSDTSYSFMNYSVRPFTNRDDAKRVEPLPDDREGLRFLYPATSTEKDAAVAVTWYDTSVPGNNGAAIAKLLCRPSRGTAFSPGLFDDYCGVDAGGNSGSTDVCPNQMLYVRYAIANYGTDPLTVNEQLWFSKNVTLDRTSGFDKKSPTSPAAKSLSHQSSYGMGRKFKVPATLSYDTDYYPIIFIDSGADFATEESTQNNAIPLRIMIHVKSQADCA